MEWGKPAFPWWLVGCCHFRWRNSGTHHGLRRVKGTDADGGAEASPNCSLGWEWTPSIASHPWVMVCADAPGCLLRWWKSVGLKFGPQQAWPWLTSCKTMEFLVQAGCKASGLNQITLSCKLCVYCHHKVHDLDVLVKPHIFPSNSSFLLLCILLSPNQMKPEGKILDVIPHLHTDTPSTLLCCIHSFKLHLTSGATL